MSFPIFHANAHSEKSHTWLVGADAVPDERGASLELLERTKSASWCPGSGPRQPTPARESLIFFALLGPSDLLILVQ